MRVALLALGLCSTSVAAETATPVALPTWLSGCWETVGGNTHTMECWTPPQGSMLFGSSITMAGGEAAFWETMQIGTNGDVSAPLIFWAAPRGEGRTAFPLQSYTNGRLRFVNADNDYPQQIEYWREGDALIGQISMLDGSKTVQWRSVRQDFSKAK